MSDAQLMTEEEARKRRRFMRPLTRINVLVYKLTGGRLMGSIGGRPILLIEMTGAQYGPRRTIPLMHVPYKDGVLIVGSQGGAPRSPVWTKNLEKNPNIVAQFRGDRKNLVARSVAEEEKDELWKVCDAAYHEFADYRARTARSIPIFDCQPA